MSCDNAFAGRVALEAHQSTIIAAINFSMMPCTLFANVLVILGLIRTRQLGSTVNNLFLCLSVSDSCISLIVQSLVGVLFTAYRQSPYCQLEMATQCLTFLFGHASGFTIVAIGIDRYIHMKYLQRYDVIMTKTRAKIMTLFSFAAAVVMGVAYTLSTVYNIFQWVNMVILLADFTAVIIIYTAYIEAYHKVKEHVKNTKGLRKEKGAPSYAISMITTILLILGAVFICYVPYVTVGIVGFHKVQIKGEMLPSRVAFAIYMTYLLVYLNSCLNALIFICKNDPVRKFVLRKLRLKWEFQTEAPAHSADSIQLSNMKRKGKIASSCESFATVTDSTVDLLSHRAINA